VVEMLSRTGMRATELCELAADAVSVRDGSHWLRIPVGKLRNDRMIPLHAELVPLLEEWTARNRVHIRDQQRLMADEHKPLDRRTVHRIVAATPIPTSSVTHWPPRPSTGACAWRPSPRCSATGPWT
jgi:site-specific recombinase XerD